MPYEYDVAISFLSRDEAIANELAARLAPLRVFVYSKQQEAIAGREGIETFGDVFRAKSLVSVVVLRRGWGGTRWTAIEEAAIRDRCLESRFESLFVYQIEADIELPGWLPETHIRFAANIFPIEQAVGAIKAKVQNMGGVVAPDNASSIALRTAARASFDAETIALFNSHVGVQRAIEQHKIVLRQAFGKCEQIRASTPALKLKFEIAQNELVFCATLEVVSLVIRWEGPINVIHDSGAIVEGYDGRILMPSEQGKFYLSNGDPNRVSREKFLVNRTAEFDFCWRESNGRTLSSDDLAEHAMARLFELFERLRGKPRQ